ncbi:hypothetical protein EPR50_G00031620 [Perca flavescens]|uniref:Uncharacterized protein n=1 Tax=Perca flavescens TaxID=8167 RepID=A0A484DJR2_PERFV|nr:hypothetical protein EPR50_G00031620 [Perca flavescens]
MKKELCVFSRFRLHFGDQAEGGKQKAEAGLTSDQKMSDLEEEEDRAESVMSGCLTLKSDQSKGLPLLFSNDPGPSDTKVQNNRRRAESVMSGCLSLKSDESKGLPLLFSNEPGPSDTKKRKRSDVSEKMHPSGFQTRAGLQEAGRTSTVQSKSVHLM